MFTIPFWVAFACAIAASLVVSIYYGRHAIHPRLRPHFGQVVILFLLMTLVSFVLSLVIARMVGAPPAKPKPGIETAVPKVPPKGESPAGVPATSPPSASPAPAPDSPAPAAELPKP